MANHYGAGFDHRGEPTNLQYRLIQAREEAGYSSIFRLSQECKIADSSIRKAESGEINALKPITLCKLAKLFGVNVEWLIIGEGPKYRSNE